MNKRNILICSGIVLGMYSLQKGTKYLFEPIESNPWEEQGGKNTYYCPSGTIITTRWDNLTGWDIHKVKRSGHIISWIRSDNRNIYLEEALVRPDGKILSPVKRTPLTGEAKQKAIENDLFCNIEFYNWDRYIIGRSVEGYRFDGPDKYPYVKY